MPESTFQPRSTARSSTLPRSFLHDSSTHRAMLPPCFQSTSVDQSMIAINQPYSTNVNHLNNINHNNSDATNQSYSTSVNHSNGISHNQSNAINQSYSTIRKMSSNQSLPNHQPPAYSNIHQTLPNNQSYSNIYETPSNTYSRCVSAQNRANIQCESENPSNVQYAKSNNIQSDSVTQAEMIRNRALSCSPRRVPKPPGIPKHPNTYAKTNTLQNGVSHNSKVQNRVQNQYERPVSSCGNVNSNIYSNPKQVSSSKTVPNSPRHKNSVPDVHKTSINAENQATYASTVSQRPPTTRSISSSPIKRILKGSNNYAPPSVDSGIQQDRAGSCDASSSSGGLEGENNVAYDKSSLQLNLVPTYNKDAKQNLRNSVGTTKSKPDVKDKLEQSKVTEQLKSSNFVRSSKISNQSNNKSRVNPSKLPISPVKKKITKNKENKFKYDKVYYNKSSDIPKSSSTPCSPTNNGLNTTETCAKNHSQKAPVCPETISLEGEKMSPPSTTAETASVRTYPSLSELNFSSIAAQKILFGQSNNSIDTLLEITMSAAANNTDVTNTHLGFL